MLRLRLRFAFLSFTDADVKMAQPKCFPVTRTCYSSAFSVALSAEYRVLWKPQSSKSITQFAFDRSRGAMEDI